MNVEEIDMEQRRQMKTGDEMAYLLRRRRDNSVAPSFLEHAWRNYCQEVEGCGHASMSKPSRYGVIINTEGRPFES